ncbi:MAG: valine--tRNA ligase [Chitinophagaceae bacterium]
MATELTKNFTPSDVETRWYQHWMDQQYFNSTPDEREPYTIVIPPPNVTGVLHMGHLLNNSIQDILARRARMLGKNVCWVPGTDHASIATEAKVVGMLREKGIAKSSMSRAQFLEHAWAWKEEYGGIILQQLRKMGCSLDWNRVNFTMDEDYYKSVINVFVDLYEKGLIYRGKRMINWDPKAKTALSDEEVIFKETQSKFYHLRYSIEGTDDSVVIATVRPETILGDTAICVHPDDERYAHLKGKFAVVPLIGRKIPIIFDEYVDKEFGTGALKVTPAHDMNDYQLGQKHNLEVIDIMNDDGTFSEAAQLYIGMDRFDVRKQIVKDLQEKGFLLEIKDYTNQVGYSERSDAVVEPRLSLQWWVKMAPLADKALQVVMNDEIAFIPAKFKNLYRHWMENIKDWCISRQLWWGHRIPAWYDENGNYVVAATEQEARDKFSIKFPESVSSPINQDEDCLDTWFSSWLWPFEVFDGLSNPGNPEVKYYYPTNTLVTAPEIIFFWVARMIMAGLEYQKEIPFKQVYFTGIVRDKQGRKMSKSLGNSPDLLKMIDDFGADAVRFGILISSPAGNDLLFDESTVEQGRNFNNKVWNALKLVKMWEDRQEDAPNADNTFAIEWFGNRLSEVRNELEQLFEQFRLSEALKTVYSLIWDDFCSWYLEWIKPGFEQPIDKEAYEATVRYFEELMQLLHPFMPFVTEEIFHQLKERAAGDDLTIKQLNAPEKADHTSLQSGALLKEVITAIRDARNKQQLKPKETIRIAIETTTPDQYKSVQSILARQVNAEAISFVDAAIAGAATIVCGKDKFYMESNKEVDKVAQKAQLEKDLAYYKGFLDTVEKKLSNERFVQNAKPEVVDIERKKKRDAEEKIRAIEEGLNIL